MGRKARINGVKSAFFRQSVALDSGGRRCYPILTPFVQNFKRVLSIALVAFYLNEYTVTFCMNECMDLTNPAFSV
jgi:hypothetical protein